MLAPIPSLTALALSLLANTATSTTTQEEPQLFANVSRLNTDDAFALFSDNASLNTRELTCGIGYTECEYDSSRCCKLGKKCCGNGYCATIGDTCCTGGGTCPIGYKCCDGTDGCAPLGGECCSGGYYCRVGKKCRIWKGERVCCSSVLGCAGENAGVGSDDGIGSGGTVTADVTSSTTTTQRETTTTYVRVDWDYYYTTIYWTYWYYYWTSFAPYTVQTVTSTRTSTRTVWSVYATDSAVATSSLEERSSSYTYFPPYSATSLKSSSEPVTLSATSATARAASDSTDDATGPSLGGTASEPGVGVAVSVGVSGTGILAAVLVAVVGGLAFGL
ncbi:uncharacterized protein N7500_002517 [Penicillium coprophilum]|uniref:uncharacterized protein n=1 Tax=Penicillium coprophilum TaxID=36646 RepID=UPI0023831FAE|nr:uncharacterized protein N7500_002517 [Penicillium coprophilum]KAJ5169734.1 hypothetical protein N7500_002517 [Penicillium coprophilum]